MEHTGVGFELVLDPVVPQLAEQLVEVFAPAPAVFQVCQASSLVVKYIAPVPAVVEYIAPAPAVVQAPSPVVENVVPAPAVFPSPACRRVHLSRISGFFFAPALFEEFISPAPAVSQSQAPVVEHLSPAPAVFRVGGLQASVPGQSSTARRGDEEAEVPRVTLLLHKRTDSKRYRMPPSQPLRYVFQAFCGCLGLRESQVRFPCDGLLSPDHSPDQLGLVDGDVLVAEEQDEEDQEVEDEDMDETYGTESRFPTEFRPMRMCRWFPSGNCRQGWVCMFAHSVSELHPKLVVTDDFYWGDASGKCKCFQRLALHTRSCVSSRDIWEISSVVFLRPFVSVSHLFCSFLLEEYNTWFWEITSGYVVFGASRFDSGYIFMPVYGCWVLQWHMLCGSYGVCCLVVDAPVVQVVCLPVVVHDRCPWFRLCSESFVLQWKVW